MSDLADDTLEGGNAISIYLFGDDSPQNLRKVYRLTSEVAPEKRLPTFKRGAITCARKSTLLRQIEEQERAAIGAPGAV
jgi:hypothetical protein